MNAGMMGALAGALMLAAAPAVVAAQASAGQSGQVIATSAGAPAPPAPAKPDEQIAQWLADASSDDAVPAAPVRDHKLHGEVSVGVGTNGYREVGGVVTGPLGDNGQATIAIDAAQYGARR